MFLRGPPGGTVQGRGTTIITTITSCSRRPVYIPLGGTLHHWRSHPNFVGGASFNKWDHRSTQSQLSRPMSSGHYTFVELGRPSNKLMHASVTAMVHTTCASWDTCPWWGPANTYHLWLVGPGSYLPPVRGTRIYPWRRPGRKSLILI